MGTTWVLDSWHSLHLHLHQTWKPKYKNLTVSYGHTSYLSFLLHGQDFQKPNFTPKKKRLKSPKILEMSLKKSNICSFSLNLEKITPDRKFLPGPRLWCR